MYLTTSATFGEYLTLGANADGSFAGVTGILFGDYAELMVYRIGSTVYSEYVLPFGSRSSHIVFNAPEITQNGQNVATENWVNNQDFFNDVGSGLIADGQTIELNFGDLNDYYAQNAGRQRISFDETGAGNLAIYSDGSLMGYIRWDREEIQSA